MAVWFSPFPLEPALKQRLLSCGWSHWEGQLTELPLNAILIYDTPDRLLSCYEQYFSFEIIRDGYKNLLTFTGANPVVSAWRLSACTNDSLASDFKQFIIEQYCPNPEPLAALIVKTAIQSQPDILDLYLDLELRAELLGSEPDVHYRKRLQNTLDPDELGAAFNSFLLCHYSLDVCLQSRALADQDLEKLKQNESKLLLIQQDLKQQLASQENSYQQEMTALQHRLSEAITEKEQTLKHLQETQSELEHHFVANRESSSENVAITEALDALRVENQDLKQQLTSKENSYRQEMTALQHRLSEAITEKEQTLKHLQETQAELEHHFVANRESSSENVAIMETLEALRVEKKALQHRLVQLDQSNQQQIASLQLQVKDLGTEKSNVLRHLQQTQNELEHYYHLSRAHSAMHLRCEHLLVRSQRLLCNFLP